MTMRWGIVIVLCASARPVAAADPPDDFGVACLDADSGVPRWQSAIEDGWPPRLRLDGGSLWEERAGHWRRRDLVHGDLRGEGAPPDQAIAADTGFWTTTDAILHDKDGQAGTVVTTGAYVDDLAVADGLLAYTLDKDDGQVYGFDLATGHLRWVLRPREHVPGFEVGDGSRVELLGDHLLVYAPSALMSIDPSTGAIAWTTEVPALAGRWGTLRAIVSGGDWVISVDGAVVAIDAATGKLRWSWDAGDGAANVLVAGGGAVCVDRRASHFEPFEKDDAEHARALEVDDKGKLTWIPRDQVPDGALRVPLSELAEATAGARITLSDGDTTRTVDASGLHGTTYVDVPGTWVSATFAR